VLHAQFQYTMSRPKTTVSTNSSTIAKETLVQEALKTATVKDICLSHEQDGPKIGSSLTKQETSKRNIANFFFFFFSVFFYNHDTWQQHHRYQKVQKQYNSVLHFTIWAATKMQQQHWYYEVSQSSKKPKRKSLWLKTQSQKQKQSSQKTNVNKQPKQKTIFLSKQNGYRKLANFYFFLGIRSR
jgi:hypothetical protein